MWHGSVQHGPQDGWDALASAALGSQLHSAQPSAAGWASAHPLTMPGFNGQPAQQTAFAGATADGAVSKKLKTAGGVAACTLSLDRYLDLVQLLTGSAGGEAQPVKRLSKLEAGAVTLGDLKQLLAIHGVVGAGSKGKQELLDLLHGMRLMNPVCIMEDGDHPAAHATGAAPPHAASAVSPSLSEAMLATLGWVPPQGGALDAALAQQGHFSCYELPQVRVQGWQPHVLQRQDVGQAPDVPSGMEHDAPLPLERRADSQATEASRPAQQLAAVQDSPAPSPPALAAATATASSSAGGGSPPGPEAQQHWLAEGLARVAATSQASLEAAAGRQLLGRKVAIVLAEGFEQGGDGIVDSLSPGIHVGQ